MRNPLLSIVIPTHNRPQLLYDAVKSALAQTIDDFEIVVVDDASTTPVDLPKHHRLKIIRLDISHGGAGARNVGTEAALGKWITYLDDDDRLLPHMAAVSLDALSQTNLPAPVGVISGIEVINAEGKIIDKRIPPAIRSQGAHFSLEKLEPGKSYNTKQTLVVEREVIRKVGGWDESFRSRVHSELFLRLNLVCSLIGLPIVTYQLYAHSGDRVSRNPTLRQESFEQLISKHKSLFQAHPRMFAEFVFEHSRKCYEMGHIGTAFSSLVWAMQIHPRYTLSAATKQFQEKLRK